MASVAVTASLQWPLVGPGFVLYRAARILGKSIGAPVHADVSDRSIIEPSIP
jgi:hypothetical protein